MNAATKSLFHTLRDTCADDWQRYVDHPFVAGMADGTLPEPAFRFYLEQDYLFLIHFARAYGLAAYKAETLEDIRGAAAGRVPSSIRKWRCTLNFAQAGA